MLPAAARPAPPPWSWSAFELNPTDTLNDRIWSESPARAAKLAGRVSLGSAGGLQEMNLDGHGPLPWVPDLVGAACDADPRVLVIGSAYAPFFGPLARRSARLDDARDYRAAPSAHAFLERFLVRVVRPDSAYYSPIGRLLDRLVAPAEVGLTDLCRVCFVQRTGGGSWTAGDPATRIARDVFAAYAAAAEDWTRTRIEQFAGGALVTLGTVARDGVLGLCDGQRPTGAGGQRQAGAAGPKLGAWSRVRIDGRVCRLVAAYHPNYANVHDPAYAASRGALAEALKDAAA